ncbi:MAG: hypothetical protein A2V99_00655 [Spirochaetes bacterium RBG_16_67_19]|nr:MAG: hypothetical protein A2V99_00655 [Spirochaetes bacterium RBG_16_67_19]
MKGVYVYEVIIPAGEKGPGWIDLPYLGPMRRDTWVDEFTPRFGLHSLRVYGPHTVYDEKGRGHRVPGQLIATRKEVGKHLTEEFTKKVSRPSWHGMGDPKADRFWLLKTVPPKLRLLEGQEAEEALSEALAPAGEAFRKGVSIGTEHCKWHDSLFTDQRHDATIPEDLAKVQGRLKAMLESGVPEDAVEEPEGAPA